jgi:cell division protein FtsB
MAKKLKRVDGVSNKRVVKATAPKGAAKMPRSGARAESVASKPETRNPKVETRRRKAAKTKTKSQAKAPSRTQATGKPAKKAAAMAGPAQAAQAAQRGRKGAKKEKTREKGERAQKLRRAFGPRTVIVLILFITFIALSASPVARNLEATSKLKAMARELAVQKKTTKTLEEQVGQARSLEYIEQEARRQRMVGPGEVLYLVTTDSEGPKVEYRLKALQSMDEAWERVRQMLHCAAPRQVKDQ